MCSNKLFDARKLNFNSLKISQKSDFILKYYSIQNWIFEQQKACLSFLIQDSKWLQFIYSVVTILRIGLKNLARKNFRKPML